MQRTIPLQDVGECWTCNGIQIVEAEEVGMGVLEILQVHPTPQHRDNSG